MLDSNLILKFSYPGYFLSRVLCKFVTKCDITCVGKLPLKAVGPCLVIIHTCLKWTKIVRTLLMVFSCFYTGSFKTCKTNINSQLVHQFRGTYEIVDIILVLFGSEWILYLRVTWYWVILSCHTFNFQVVLGHALNSRYTRHYDRPHHVIYIDL